MPERELDRRHAAGREADDHGAIDAQMLEKGDVRVGLVGRSRGGGHVRAEVAVPRRPDGTKAWADIVLNQVDDAIVTPKIPWLHRIGTPDPWSTYSTVPHDVLSLLLRTAATRSAAWCMSSAYVPCRIVGGCLPGGTQGGRALNQSPKLCTKTSCRGSIDDVVIDCHGEVEHIADLDLPVDDPRAFGYPAHNDLE
jgi:hypothetical protein